MFMKAVKKSNRLLKKFQRSSKDLKQTEKRFITNNDLLLREYYLKGGF